MPRPALETADIFRRHGAAWRAAHFVASRAILAGEALTAGHRLYSGHAGTFVDVWRRERPIASSAGA